jgi:hypothetical protein
MRHRGPVVILIACCLVLASSTLANVVRPGSTILDRLRDLKPNQSVVIARVTEVEYAIGREWAPPRVLLEIESVLWGSPVIAAPVYPSIYFARHGREWTWSTMEGRQWIAKGDRAVLALYYHETNPFGQQRGGANTISFERFLGPGALADTMAVLETTKLTVDWAAVAGNGEGYSAEAMQAIVHAEYGPTGCTLGDIKRAVGGGKRAK